MGIYRGVIVTCRYHTLNSRERIDQGTLYSALGRVILAQPMLRVGLLRDDTNEASFAHIEKLSLGDHASFSTLPCQSLDEYNEQLATRQGWHHDQCWLDIAGRPPWRVEVVEPALTEPSGFQDIIFAFHHSLCDGTSGRIFHEQLLRELNNQSAPPAVDVLEFPQPPQLPDSQDEAVPFSNSPWFIVKTLWNEFGPSVLRSQKPIPWHGKGIDFSIPYTTRIRPIDVPAAVASKMLGACRQHKTSLTGLIHALVLASYATRLSADEAPFFASITPISLRPYLRPGADASLLRVLVASLTQEYPPEHVAQLRSGEPTSLDTCIWSTAQLVKGELSRRASTLPQDEIVSLMKYIPDWFAFFKAKDGQPRTHSWELSNIGVFEAPRPASAAAAAAAEPASDARFGVSRMCFTNGAVVAGAPVGLGVASAPNGLLTIALSWQQTVVTDDFIAGLANDLRAFVQRFDHTGRFTP